MKESRFGEKTSIRWNRAKKRIVRPILDDFEYLILEIFSVCGKIFQKKFERLRLYKGSDVF